MSLIIRRCMVWSPAGLCVCESVCECVCVLKVRLYTVFLLLYDLSWPFWLPGLSTSTVLLLKRKLLMSLLLLGDVRSKTC